MIQATLYDKCHDKPFQATVCKSSFSGVTDLELSGLQSKRLSSALIKVEPRVALWKEWGFSPTPIVSLSLDKKKMN